MKGSPKQRGPLVCVVVGTRPELIKMAPVLSELKRKKIRTLLIHTGQHYSPEMDAIFFKELGIQKPDYNLGVNTGAPGNVLGAMISQISDVLEKRTPDVVIVQGDTNSAFAGALAGNKSNIPVAHVEAGLRSYDRSMPEEINRVLVDHIADVLFAPTPLARKNLLAENIPSHRIKVVGNTVVDALRIHRPTKVTEKNVLHTHKVTAKKYSVLTLHRPANVDNPTTLKAILKGIAPALSYGPLLFPVHPRTRQRITQFGIILPDGIRLIDPVGYKTMLSLIRNAKVVLSDSGGLQEECSVLGTHCVTLRPNTERPEAIAVGGNVLAPHPKDIEKAITDVLTRKRWKQPFGSGRSAESIVETVLKKYGSV